MPEGGFGLRLDAINAWHLYTKNKQRRARPHQVGQQKFGRWCFESFETAEKFSERFGGEILTIVAKASEGGVANAPLMRTAGRETSNLEIPDRV
jgi:hypothetical protein